MFSYEKSKYLYAFIIGSIFLSFFSTIQKLSMGYPLVMEAYIIPVIIGGIVGLILCLYFNKYKKEAEKYRNISKKLEKANNEYAKTCDEVDALAGNLEKMIKLTSGMNFTVNNSDEAVFLKELLDTARTLIPEADYGSVSIVNGDKWEYIDAFGHDLNKLKKIDLKKEYMLNYQGVQIVDSIVDENLKIMPELVYEDFKDASKRVKTSLLVSVDVQGERLGNICFDIDINSEEEFSKQSFRVLEAFRNMASAFFTFKKYSTIQSEFQKEIILSITHMLEIHDEYTSGHSENVANIARLIAENMGLNHKAVNDTYWAGVVHDIGKILIPENILNKAGSLSDKEYEIIRKHPVWGYQTLKKSKDLKKISRYVLYHHERWDGKGYPEGLEKDEIPLFSQIICLADAWDAMHSDRAYRKKLSLDKAISEVKKNRGTQFSPALVDVFLKIINKKEEIFVK